MSTKVGVIALRYSNWRSVFRMIESLGYSPVAIGNPSEIDKLSHLILPGVGSFGAVIEELKDKKLFEACKQLIDGHIKVLGLCVGMQIMGRKSDESPDSVGFSWFEMDCTRLALNGNQRQFHTGWNFCRLVGEPDTVKVFDQSFFFNHAFGFPLRSIDTSSLGITNFHGDFISYIKTSNIMGAQFHPEKSQYAGRNFLKYFLGCA